MNRVFSSRLNLSRYQCAGTDSLAAALGSVSFLLGRAKLIRKAISMSPQP